LIIADLRELSNQLEGLVLGDAMVLAGGIACNAKLGRDLNVNGTPTFFINGIKVPTMRPAYFDALIAYELARAESGQTR